MVRDRDPADFKNILHDTAIWTDYDGVSPMSDWVMDTSVTSLERNLTHFATGVAEFDHATGVTNYMHGDQIGSTRMETLAGAVDGVVTYTAFGEPVTESGNVGTRYRYAGGWGYENFDAMDWGKPMPANTHEFEFPYLHVGARYYDPATGRFLQRDPIGVRGGLNVFEYVESRPVSRLDPSGLGPIDWTITGQWNPTPAVRRAALDAFDRSNHDRTCGTLDFGVSHVTMGWVPRAPGVTTFDKDNRDNACLWAGRIVNTCEAAYGGVFFVKKASRAVGRSFIRTMEDITCCRWD